jgi:hypothetical protein
MQELGHPQSYAVSEKREARDHCTCCSIHATKPVFTEKAHATVWTVAAGRTGDICRDGTHEGMIVYKENA